jgi:hypothetical protein
MELGVDDVASSVTRPNHLAEREQIVAAEIAAGWQPLCMRGSAAVQPMPRVAASMATPRRWP